MCGWTAVNIKAIWSVYNVRLYHLSASNPVNLLKPFDVQVTVHRDIFL